MGASIGIDLGSVSSFAAVMIDGEVVHLSPSEGIPSVVTVDESGELEVGDAAVTRLDTDPLAGLWGSKRLLGHTQRVIDEVRQLFTYEIVDGDESEIALKLCNHTVSLERVTTSILKEVVRVAGEKLGEPVTAAVIATPTNFTSTQRSALRNSVEAAGIELLEFINEPTATALAFGHKEGIDERVAVFDLGGGTLDISVIDIRGDEYEIVASGGDTFLGGVDFDRCLSNWITERHLCEKTDLHNGGLGPLSVERIRKGAEEAKIALSEDESYPITIVGVGDDRNISDLDMVVERSDLERVTFSLVQESMKSLRRVAEIAEKGRKIDTLLMVGGQSQMPIILERARSVLPGCKTPTIDPTRTVCAGAAILAEALSYSETPAKKVSDILSQEIAIERSSGDLFTLFPAGTALPANQSLSLTTDRDGQTSIELSLVQGSSGKMQPLRGLSIGPLEKLPAGEVVKEAAFHLNRCGELSISGDWMQPHKAERDFDGVKNEPLDDNAGDLSLDNADPSGDKFESQHPAIWNTTELTEELTEEISAEIAEASQAQAPHKKNGDGDEEAPTTEANLLDLGILGASHTSEELPWDDATESQEPFSLEDDWMDGATLDTALLPRPIPGIHTHSRASSKNDPAKNPLKWLGEFFRGLFGG